LQIQHNSTNNNSFTSPDCQKILQLLCQIRGTDSIYDLIQLYEKKLLSNELLEEMTNLKPNLKIKIRKDDPQLTYKEFPDILIDKQVFTFGLFGNPHKQSLSINYKMKYPHSMENNLKIISVLTVVDVKMEKNKRSVKLKSFCCDKNQTNVFYLDEGSNFIREDYSKLSLKMYIKVCYTYSFLQNYFLLNFTSFYNNLDVSRLSKNQFKNIIFNPYLKYDNYLQVYRCLTNWLSDQKNMRGKLNILLENVSWDKISDVSMIEFIMQFGPLIEKYELKSFFHNIIDSRMLLLHSM